VAWSWAVGSDEDERVTDGDEASFDAMRGSCMEPGRASEDLLAVGFGMVWFGMAGLV
jgi:hypothetical protein